MSRPRLLTCFFLTGLLLSSGTSRSEAVSPERIQSLFQGRPASHPRLLFTKPATQPWRQEIQADPLLKETQAELLRQAREMLSLQPVLREKIGRRLLDQSRRCLRRVTLLAMAYRLTGEPLFLDRAEQEMLAAAAFEDWNPSHFLDTAEMTMALAIGYDWLFERLPEDSRETIRTAILGKGLQPSLDEPAAHNGWLKAEHNWNQVCHAGMLFGALAIFEDSPEPAARIVARAINGVPQSMKTYAPDGAYPEGPGYWEYGTTFNVLLIAALESALGTDFELSRQSGFLKTADYYLHMTGPAGLYFNYSDCGAKGSPSPAMAWFARRLKAPYLLWNELPELRGYNRERVSVHSSSNRHFPLFLIWYHPGEAIPAPTTLSWTGQGLNPVAAHRSSWKDPDAVYLAVKAGSPSVNHGHMDAGSFVLEAGGVRWALDLGSQDYNSLESKGLDIWNRGQNSQRWQIFRYHNLTHNTLVVDGQPQQVAGYARILESTEKPVQTTLMDLGEVYRDQLAGAQRRFSLLPGGEVLIEDQLQALDRPSKVRWGMVTPAQVRLENPAKASLEKNGKQLSLSAEGTEVITWEIYPTDPPPTDYDAPNPDTRMVGFTVPVTAGEKKVLKVRMRLVRPSPL